MRMRGVVCVCYVFAKCVRCCCVRAKLALCAGKHSPESPHVGHDALCGGVCAVSHGQALRILLAVCSATRSAQSKVERGWMHMGWVQHCRGGSGVGVWEGNKHECCRQCRVPARKQGRSVPMTFEQHSINTSTMHQTNKQHRQGRTTGMASGLLQTGVPPDNSDKMRCQPIIAPVPTLQLPDLPLWLYPCASKQALYSCAGYGCWQ